MKRGPKDDGALARHLARGGLLYIVAGAYMQAFRWAQERRLEAREWRFVTGARAVAGTRGASFVRVGTWAERADRRDMDAAIAAAQWVEL